MPTCIRHYCSGMLAFCVFLERKYVIQRVHRIQSQTNRGIDTCNQYVYFGDWMSQQNRDTSSQQETPHRSFSCALFSTEDEKTRLSPAVLPHFMVYPRQRFLPPHAGGPPIVQPVPDLGQAIIDGSPSAGNDAVAETVNTEPPSSSYVRQVNAQAVESLLRESKAATTKTKEEEKKKKRKKNCVVCARA